MSLVSFPPPLLGRSDREKSLAFHQNDGLEFYLSAFSGSYYNRQSHLDKKKCEVMDSIFKILVTQ